MNSGNGRQMTDRIVRRTHWKRRLPALAAMVIPCALSATDLPAGSRAAAEAPARVATGAASAAERIAVNAPPAVAASLEIPRLSGRGLLRWFGLRVYEATLWVPATGFDPSRPLKSAFVLDLRYERALDGAAIAETSAKEMARLGMGTPARRDEWRDALRRILPDVRAGDRLTGVHQPGRPVRFFRNDTPIGTVEDPEFGAAFFSIWLDAQTAAPELRSALLAGGARPGSAGRQP